MMDMACVRRMRWQGFTLIEALVVVAIMSILAALAAPSFEGTFDKYRLKGAADAIFNDLQFARAESVKNNQTVFVNFTTGASWCYGLNLGSACDCATSGSCALKQVSSSEYTGITLSSSTFAADPSFDPVRGLATQAGSLVLQSSVGKQAQISLTLIGRVDICSPSAATSVGYQAC